MKAIRRRSKKVRKKGHTHGCTEEKETEEVEGREDARSL